jgi:transglutaminase-like putative cysteine protease
MIYDIRHVTAYDYRFAVPFARCLLRLLPVDRPGQTVRSATLAVTPSASAREDGTDFFGNRISRVTLAVAHSRLLIEARSEVEVAPRPVTGPGDRVARLRIAALAAGGLDGASPLNALFPSRLVPLVEPISRYALRSLPDGRPFLTGVADLNARIRTDFTYDPKATDVTTTPARAFETRRGVCQDFAHVMIAGLRGLGLPARYVSGYLRTVPPPGQPRLEGADAMHAWVEVWAGPEIGWVGFDPTNGISAGEDHVVVAVGRDYADVSPIDGVVRAAGSHDLSVAVDVIPREAAVAPAKRDAPAPAGG